MMCSIPPFSHLQVQGYLLLVHLSEGTGVWLIFFPWELGQEPTSWILHSGWNGLLYLLRQLVTRYKILASGRSGALVTSNTSYALLQFSYKASNPIYRTWGTLKCWTLVLLLIWWASVMYFVLSKLWQFQGGCCKNLLHQITLWQSAPTQKNLVWSWAVSVLLYYLIKIWYGSI